MKLSIVRQSPGPSLKSPSPQQPLLRLRLGSSSGSGGQSNSGGATVLKSPLASPRISRLGSVLPLANVPPSPILSPKSQTVLIRSPTKQNPSFTAPATPLEPPPLPPVPLNISPVERKEKMKTDDAFFFPSETTGNSAGDSGELSTPMMDSQDDSIGFDSSGMVPSGEENTMSATGFSTFLREKIKDAGV